MTLRLADRIQKLPPYLFAEIDRLKSEQIQKGVDVIDLGVGDPDQPTPPHILSALEQAARDPANHRYPSYEGLVRFREAAARWMERRYNVKPDPATEVLALIGSKEGIAHFPLAFVNPGDVVLTTSPGYPPWTTGTLFAGGTPYELPLRRENRFLPDLEAIPKEVLKKARIITVNYPNNPTGAVAPRSFYETLVGFAAEHNLIIASDAAYAEMYGAARPGSVLEIPGARDLAIEFHSLSKTFNMTGWRIGWACGNSELVGGLGKIKTNIDSGVFQAVQIAAVAALEGPTGCVEEMRALYARRRSAAVSGLRKIGIDVACAEAAFYLWLAVPKGETSASFAKRILEEVGVVVTPGTGFGPAGEGYARIALTRDEKRIAEAIERIGGIRW